APVLTLSTERRSRLRSNARPRAATAYYITGSADAGKNQTRDRIVNCHGCNGARGMLAVPFQPGNPAAEIYGSDESRQWRTGEPDLAQHGRQEPRRLCAQPGNATELVARRSAEASDATLPGQNG